MVKMNGLVLTEKYLVIIKRYSASWTSDMIKKSKSSVMESPLPWWLFGTAGLVGITLTVGAAARLTRTGASTLYWKPHFMHSPKTESEWHDEFQVYHDFCARSQRTPMTLEDFKRNYKWESAHRKFGQLTALSFVLPLTYFAAKGKIPIPAQAPLALAAALGGTQLYVGREMVEKNVKSGKKSKRDEEPMFEGATFFLPVHSALSLANFSLLLWTGLGIISPVSRAITVRGLMTPGVLKEMGEVRKHLVALTGLAAGTALAGSLVSEIDGGREFQTFPKMGDRWIPHGLFDQKPWLRNFYDNVALVQLDHRLLALTTLAAYTAVFMKARKPSIWSNLPEDAKRAMILAFTAVGGQVFMGATMLVNEVPTSLAMVHQSGAVLVLGSSLWAVHSLRFARPDGLLGAAVATAASKADAQPSQIKTLCQEAAQYSFCSVCVNSSYASLARKTLDELKDSSKTHVKVCCAVGFPLGACTTATKAFEAQQCLDAGAEEIDMVINVGMLHAEEYDYVLRDICAVVAVCKERGAISKVILETALLTTEQIRKASELAISAGADFIKTSTGFSTRELIDSLLCVGASEEDVKLMASIAKPAGKQVKASGGIRSAADAEKMVALGATRLGTSAGVKIAQGQQSTDAY
ncbi:Deoxyribose-phosphate aldolase [Phytophthora citrophthora]|uniref:deoxyribose-phosphate aldolase n=1 Tax=Phytophthora citrophthora TaxID=4793 RepID=A0AAD9G4L1_9STRA|nr:Deoxyribose-phosphate aldolase [Phytophthora citrophthora]